MMTTNNANPFSCSEYIVLKVLNDCKKYNAKELSSETGLSIGRIQAIIHDLLKKDVSVEKTQTDGKRCYYLKKPYPLPAIHPKKARTKEERFTQVEIDLIKLFNTQGVYTIDEIKKILATSRYQILHSFKYLRTKGIHIERKLIGRSQYEFFTTQVYDLSNIDTKPLIVTKDKHENIQQLENKIKQLQEDITKEFSFEKCRELSRLTIKLESFRLRPAPTEEFATNNIRIINNPNKPL